MATSSFVLLLFFFRLASSYILYPNLPQTHNISLVHLLVFATLRLLFTFRKEASPQHTHHTSIAVLALPKTTIMTLRGIGSKNNQPGMIVGNVRSPLLPFQQPYSVRPRTGQDPTRIPAPGNDATNDNTSPPASDGNSGNGPDKSPAGPTDEDDDGMSTLEKMLNPPDFDTNLRSKDEVVKVFRGEWQPHIRMGPFFPQPPNAAKERKGSFNCRRNRINKRLRASRNSRANRNGDSDDKDDDKDNDGDDEDDSPHDDPDADPITPGLTSSATTSQLDLPATPHATFRTQEIDTDSDSDSHTTSPGTYVAQPKRKRDESKAQPATPSQGQRVSKRQRNSIGDTPLPAMPPSKRTRSQQKKFQAKLNYLIFDRERPGSVEREAVEIKSGAQKWRKTSLHDEPWDGSPKSK